MQKNEPQKVINTLYALFIKLNSRRKFQLYLLFISIVFGSTFELLSITSSFPFLAVLVNPDVLFKNTYTRSIINYLNIENSSILLTYFSLAFIFAVLLSGLLRVLNLYFICRLSALFGNDLSIMCFKKLLNQPYDYFLYTNSSFPINTITRSIMRATVGFDWFFQICISSVFLVIVGLTLLVINFKITSLIILFIWIIYFFLIKKTNSIQYGNSRLISNLMEGQVKYLQECISLIKEIIIDNKKKYFINNFSVEDKLMRFRESENLFLALSPRYLLETFVLISIAITGWVFSLNDNNNQFFIPILGSIVFAAQKLFPNIQTVYANYSRLKGISGDFENILKMLNLKSNSKLYNFQNKALNFKNLIEFRSVSFKYKETNTYLLKNINLKINKGDRVGIIGDSGSGKTTLINILLGLLSPDSGKVLVDSRDIFENNDLSTLLAWQKNLSLVPQNVVLKNASFVENIALGINDNQIELDRVLESSKNAMIFNFIDNLKSGFKTNVGELGNNLSGGQIKRVGVARALYKNPKLMVFDEATSGLDPGTEDSILKNIYSLNNEVTIIMITHNIKNLYGCNRIYRICNNSILKLK